MAKRENCHSEMVYARQSDCFKVFFDQQSPTPFHPRSRSRSRSSSGSSHTSGSRRGRGSYRRRYRSSSSSSSSVSKSRSTSRTRSRSRPRCHRRSSRCRCDNHYRYSRRSPPRRYRAHSRSFSRSPSDRYSARRHYRSRSRSSRSYNSHRRRASRLSRSPPRSNRGGSRSSERSVKLRLDDKEELFKIAKENAAKILGVETLELPESVKPILSDELVQSEHGSPAPKMMGRQESEKTPSQNEVEPDELFSLRMSPKRRMISFSINNSVAKPTVVAPSCAKVTPRVDSYESRKPYGHWIPVISGRGSLRRKRSRNTSH